MNKTKLVSVLALTAALSACGGGGSGGGGVPESRPSGSVSGTAFDGLILNGDVKVYAWNGKKGELLGEGQTNSAGIYSITLNRVESQPILIEVTGGRYTEEASGRNVALRGGDFLYGVEDYVQGEEITTSLTYYTTLATGLAEYMVRTGQKPGVAIDRANEVVSDMLGFDIQKITPLEITDRSNATPVVTDEHLYGFATASISQLTAWISEQNNDDPHKEYNSIKFAAAAYQDIASDGQLDGKDQGRIIAQGVVRLTPDIYRSDIARNMLVMANSNVNVTGLSPLDILPMAQYYNQSNAAMFAGAEIQPLDGTAPNINNLSHSDGEVIAGTVTLSASVTDTVGLDEVSLFIDGTLHEYLGSESSPVFTVDTSTLNDGVHTFEIYTKNITGGEATETLELVVSNAGTAISHVVPEDQSILTGVQTFSAKVTDPIGIESVSFILDGAIYPLAPGETPSKEFNLSNMLEGEHELVVSVVNSVGHKTDSTISFTVDNTQPVASWNLENTTVMSETEAFEATITDNEEVIAAELYIDGVLLDVFTEFPISRSLNTRDFTEGEKAIVLEAWDEAGNRTTLQRKVLFDSTPPTLSINSPAAGTRFSGDIPVQVNAYDAVGIESLQVLINGSLFRNLTVDQNGNASTTIPAASYENGTYSVTVKATDKAGYSVQRSSAVGFYAQPPKLEITHFVNRLLGNRYSLTELDFEVANEGPGGRYELHRMERNGRNVTKYYNSNFNSGGTYSSSSQCENVATNEFKFWVKDSNGLVSAPLTVRMTCP